MTVVNWSQATKFYSRVNALIQANVTRSDWIGFMDALGWMENDGKYDGLGGANRSYVGIYQVGDSQLNYVDFLSGMGAQFLGVSTKMQLSQKIVSNIFRTFRSNPANPVMPAFL